MDAREIDRIVIMTTAEATQAREALYRRDRRTYEQYVSAPTIPVAAAGTPQAAGHGSWVSDPNRGGVQDRWHLARQTLTTFDQVRSGSWMARLTPTGATYAISLGGRVHEIEVEGHGVDLTGIENPTAAIAAVRSAKGLPF